VEAAEALDEEEDLRSNFLSLETTAESATTTTAARINSSRC